MCHDWIVDVFSQETRRCQGSREMKLSSDEDKQASGGQPQHVRSEPWAHQLPLLLSSCGVPPTLHGAPSLQKKHAPGCGWVDSGKFVLAPPHLQSSSSHRPANTRACLCTLLLPWRLSTPPKMSFGSMTAAKADYELPSPPSDGVSDLTFSPNGSLVTAGSWDNGVSECLLHVVRLSR